MIIATTIKEVRKHVKSWKREGMSVGFVPTMGYLHEGHASLVQASVSRCDKTVASVFVNPTQFGEGEDLESYPRDFERDCALLESIGCDLVFHPDVKEMYEAGFATYVEIESDMPKQLCGKTRPIHFKGVCTVVCKLFNIVMPDCAFFGKKDAQQLAIIKKMTRDLSMDVEIVGCPIIREEDGLAKSSRNTYLNKEERQAALILSKSIALGENLIKNGERDAKKVVGAMEELVKSEPMAKIDYISAVDAKTMMDAETIMPDTLVAMAVYIGKTRLIDNFIVEE